jgi:hypothetical protein
MGVTRTTAVGRMTALRGCFLRGDANDAVALLCESYDKYRAG